LLSERRLWGYIDGIYQELAIPLNEDKSDVALTIINGVSGEP
jgi:hypothetical protein